MDGVDLHCVVNLICSCSNYEKLVLDEVPDIVRNCIQFLQSEAFFLILSNLTGLKLHRLAVTSPDSDEEEGLSSAAVSGGVDQCCCNTVCVMIVQARR